MPEYPYDIRRKCPQCKKFFAFTIWKPEHLKYYPKCDNCLTRPRKDLSGTPAQVARDQVAGKAERDAKFKAALFKKHDEKVETYYQLLRRHKGLKGENHE